MAMSDALTGGLQSPLLHVAPESRTEAARRAASAGELVRCWSFDIDHFKHNQRSIRSRGR